MLQIHNTHVLHIITELFSICLSIKCEKKLMWTDSLFYDITAQKTSHE